MPATPEPTTVATEGGGAVAQQRVHHVRLTLADSEHGFRAECLVLTADSVEHVFDLIDSGSVELHRQSAGQLPAGAAFEPCQQRGGWQSSRDGENFEHFASVHVQLGRPR
ncbi:hypothetical protein AB0M45_30510 [Nocardia sp. NPDC051787]|uniref:hypothetical protein n=1 Tax=Nocardia sp. NPDC051787 TaxID=3155415 RepID=UPI0034447298